jgi:hypothetical protein
MSAHGDHADDQAADAHDHDDDHHAPPPLEEPATPLWLTLLGIGLFLAAGIVFVATRETGKTTAELTAVPSAEAPANAAPTPAPNDQAAPNPAAAARPPGAANAAAAPNPGAMRPGQPPAPGRAPGGGSKQPGHEGHDHD